jgi:hypothetical protein
MNFYRERLGEEISQVVCATPPLNDELALTDTIANPVEPHIDLLAALDFDCIIGDANSTFVVAQEKRRVLRITQVCQRIAKVSATLCGKEQTSVFSFCGGRHDDGDDAAESVDSTVDLSGSIAIP